MLLSLFWAIFCQTPFAGLLFRHVNDSESPDSRFGVADSVSLSSEGHPHTEGTFTVLVNVRNLELC